MNETVRSFLSENENAAENLRVLETNTALLERLFETISSHRSSTPSEVAECFLAAHRLHEQADLLAKRLYHLKDKLGKSVLPSVMESEGLSFIGVPHLGKKFTVQEKLSASFIDKEAGFQWLRSIGQGDIITETVNAGTLSTFVRSLILEEGTDPPSDIVKVSTYKTTLMTKYTPK